jgi:hypothetical protein
MAPGGEDRSLRLLISPKSCRVQPLRRHVHGEFIIREPLVCFLCPIGTVLMLLWVIISMTYFMPPGRQAWS